LIYDGHSSQFMAIFSDAESRNLGVVIEPARIEGEDGDLIKVRRTTILTMYTVHANGSYSMTDTDDSVKV